MTTCEKKETLYPAYADLMRDFGIRESTNFGTLGRSPLTAFYWEIPYLDPEIVISSVLWPTQIPFDIDVKEREKHLEAELLSSFPEDSAILIGGEDMEKTVILFPESSGVINAEIGQLRERSEGGLIHLLEQHPEVSRGLSSEELDKYSKLIAEVESQLPVGEPLW